MMMLCRSFVVFLLLSVLICIAHGNEIIKSSLTFVIDDTGSMWNEIDQVKRDVNAIFDTVALSNVSQIENFVLVTFNDPHTNLRTITKDRNEYKTALASITVDGGGDCEEMALTGLEQALTNSLPNSYLFVFTDASAKDYNKFDLIKSISQKKQSQVVFVLTGDCGDQSSNEYQVYHKVAKETKGQVFRVGKYDIKDVLKYVKELIKERGEELVSKDLPPGYGHKVPYTVDTPGPVLISATGDKPKIGSVTGPDGSKPKTEHILELDKVAIVKVNATKPGLHEVEIGSKSETHATITEKTSISFLFGFSAFKPSSIKETATKPPPEGNAFLSIKLFGEGVKLTTATILDMSDNVISTLPLEMVDEKEKFYVTSLFDPPSSGTTFRVSVTGYDVETKTPIKRTSLTPLTRQDVTTVVKENKAPKVSIEGHPKLVTDYDAPLQLKCKVHGYPKPDIIWKEMDTGIVLPAKVSVIDVPYDYISIMDIKKATKNTTYQCEATNSLGKNNAEIEVITERKIYFDVIEVSKDVAIEYDKEGSIVCKVDAFPTAKITWYKNGDVLSSDGNIEISADETTLTIKHMRPELDGAYLCEARNEFQRKLMHPNIIITGLEKPSIDKKHSIDILVRMGSDAELSCRVDKGVPPPKINWYFMKKDRKTLELMKESSETIHLRHVSLDQSGTYKCIAENVKGFDHLTMELHVLYPPTIRRDVKNLKIKDGDDVTIKCDVDGSPAPEVKWFANSTRLESTKKTYIADDHSLRLKATIADTGTYTCEASNELGDVMKTVFVQVYVPVNIEMPRSTKIETLVGSHLILPCRADGYPKPDVTWIFQSVDPKTPPKSITSVGNSIPLRSIQLDQQGRYICVASNIISGTASLTYEVDVFAPPVIQNLYPEKSFEVVEGDLVLRIQCNAKGSPKPTITWKKDGFNIAFGSEWYDMEEDGTLIIKNIDDKSQGTYVCQAQNIMGYDTEVYDVVVNKYPKGRATSTVFLVEGETKDLECELPHKPTDSLRWYKDGRIIKNGELTLINVAKGDDGLYSCRVSDFERSRSMHVIVNIGFKPTFLTKEDENIDFDLDNLAWLVCEANGEPSPKVSWKYNGKNVADMTEMNYPVQMKFNTTGTYECEVYNDFGSIHRKFKITPRDCILNTKTDFSIRQPLMTSKLLTWPNFEIIDDQMIIPKNDYFYLNCPSGFASFPLGKKVTAYCEGETKVKINGNIYNFKELKCNEEVKPEVEKTGIPCLSGNTEKINIGYRMYTTFLKVYEICMDKDNKVALFTKHELSSEQSDTLRETKWFNSDILPFNFDNIYDCKRQDYHVTSMLRRGLRTHPSCCFARRKLVNARDLRPGIPATASSTYLNVVPHWNTCNSKNWEDVENRVRNLVKAAHRDLLVYTGTAQKLRMPDFSGTPVDISLHDDRGRSQPVAEYLWKVVQDESTSSSLVIVQVNIPDLSPAEALRHVYCYDICEMIEWMKSTNWKNVEDGFTYCCTITEFESAFGYEGKFVNGNNRVLFDAYLLSGSYLTV